MNCARIFMDTSLDCRDEVCVLCTSCAKLGVADQAVLWVVCRSVQSLTNPQAK